jgi:signal transduction histidine kinase
MIRYLLADLPRQSEEVWLISDLDRIILDVEALENALSYYTVSDSTTLKNYFENQLTALDQKARSISAENNNLPPALVESYKAVLSDIEGIVNSAETNPEALESLSNKLALLSTHAKTAHHAQRTSIYERIAAVQGSGRTAIWTLIIGMLTGLILTGLIAYRIGSHALEPIETFIQSAKKIGDGQLDAPISYKENDEFKELAVAFTDMSERLRAYHAKLSAEAQAERERMITLLSFLPFPVFFFGRDLELIVKNHAGDHLLQSREYDGELPEAFLDIVKRVRDESTAYSPDKLDAAIFTHAHNDELAFLPRAFHLDPPETDDGVALVLIDVTKLRLSSDLRSDLISIISHELKTPLTSTRMALHVLLENGESLSSIQEDMITTIQGEIDRYIRTIDNLLDLTRLAKGTRALNRKETSIEELFEEIKSSSSDQIDVVKHPLQIDMQDNLPSIHLDPDRIRLAMGCLISNAAQHSPDGSKIHLEAHAVENGVTIEIQDQGVGIQQEYQEKIFERFFRVPGDETSGEGIGLSVARELVEAHGGELTVYSVEGNGSTFTIFLPHKYS